MFNYNKKNSECNLGMS